MSAMSDTAVVVTSIFAPNAVMRQIASQCRDRGHRFVVAGDARSPADFALDGCDFLSLEAQRATGFAYAEQAPVGHYARKNVGYLSAIAGGAKVLIETDDDNFPEDGFFEPLPVETSAATVSAPGWCNVYAYYSEEPVWPRGLPLDAVGQAPPQLPSQKAKVIAPIQQGLADDNPDVDAVYRLTRPLPLAFHRGERRVALGRGVWCPYNSQNTVHYAPAFALAYLPAYCSFRMTDIWRSFIAQRIAWEAGWHILFREPTVRQERNEHDLMRDFADEVPGYLHNRSICAMLEALPLESGEAAIPANLRACYTAMVDAGHVGAEELPLLDAWLDDLAAIG